MGERPISEHRGHARWGKDSFPRCRNRKQNLHCVRVRVCVCACLCVSVCVVLQEMQYRLNTPRGGKKILITVNYYYLFIFRIKVWISCMCVWRYSSDSGGYQTHGERPLIFSEEKKLLEQLKQASTIFIKMVFCSLILYLHLNAWGKVVL